MYSSGSCEANEWEPVRDEFAETDRMGEQRGTSEEVADAAIVYVEVCLLVRK